MSKIITLITCVLSITKSDASIDSSILSSIGETHLQWLRKTSSPETVPFQRHEPLTLDTSSFDLEGYDPQFDVYNFNHSLRISSNGTLKGSEFFPKCADDLVQVLYNLNSSWAIKMLDSNGKMMSGILDGSVTWPGNYRECLDVYSPLDDKDHGDFYGRYCMSNWSLNLTKDYQNLPLSVGICVPNSCEGDDIFTATKNVLKISGRVPLVKKLASKLNLKSVTCKTGTKSPDAAVIIYLLVIFVFIALVIIGSSITAYTYLTDRRREYGTLPFSTSSNPLLPKISNSSYATAYSSFKEEASKSINSNDTETTDAALIENKTQWTSSKNSSIKEFFLCFCAFTNGRKILNTDVPNSQMRSIHGVRFLSLTWVIIGHTYITAVSDISNKFQTLKDIDGFSFQMLMQTPFSVDSFFLLSGCLLAYLYLKEADQRNGKINYIYFYLHRIWRLTPVYMLLVGFHILVYKYMGSGPFWKDDHGDSCRHTWWWYLLYINNFIPIRDMCIGWSWYLANDMQFYIISPLFLYPLWRWKKVGITLILAALAASCAISGILTDKYDIIPMLSGVTEVKDFIAYENRMWDSFDIIYDKPYTRISPYLVGILLGYALHVTKHQRNFLSSWQQLLGWILAVAISSSTIFGLYHVEMTRAIMIIYNSFSRTSFVLGLAWLIFACETGHGGPLYELLSWKVLVPLSRLTYCAYLVHPLLVHGYYEGLQTVLYFTHTTIVTVFLGILVATYILAFAVSFTFESPMMNLEKWILKGKR